MKNTEVQNVDSKSSDNIYLKFSTKRIILITLFSLFSIAILATSLSLNYQGRLFHNTSYIDPITGEGVVKMAAYQYYTYTCFTLVTAYYFVITAFLLTSLFLKRDVKYFDKIMAPVVKNMFIFTYISMFVIVVTLLGPYSLYVLVSDSGTSTPTTDAAADSNHLASSILTVIIHIFLPIMAFIEHFTFTPIKELKKNQFLWWNLSAIVYMSYTIPIGIVQSNQFGFSIYPYFFVDPAIVTVGGVVAILIALYFVSYYTTYMLMWWQNRQIAKSEGNEYTCKFHPWLDTKEIAINSYNYIRK